MIIVSMSEIDQELEKKISSFLRSKEIINSGMNLPLSVFHIPNEIEDFNFSPKRKKSFMSIGTFLSKRYEMIPFAKEAMEIGYPNYVHDWEKFKSDISKVTVRKLEEAIKHFIHSLFTNPNKINDDKNLYILFNLIQLWGGVEGRRAFMGSGINISSYRSYLKAWVNWDGDIDQMVAKTIMLCNSNEKFNISFATKHSKFFGDVYASLHGKYEFQVGIFDKLINNKLFCRDISPNSANDPDIERLKCYWYTLREIYVQFGKEPRVVERHLFNLEDA